MDTLCEGRSAAVSMILSTEDVRSIIKRLAEVFEENKERLNDLDTKLGDGDHGRSMSLGFFAVSSYVKDNPQLTIKQMLMDGGMRFNDAAGSTIGILIFSAMREAGKALGEREQIGLADLKEMLDAAISGIVKRGKAAVGQKTILDSLDPALQVLQEGLKSSMADETALIQSVIEAASAGAESTRAMKPAIGRAKWFVERSQGEIDPGAVSGALIIRTVCEYLLEKNTA
jgi:dihydroxyacetone kinase-like protein